MALPPKRTVTFINQHHVLTLATAADNIPWCANCFYAYSAEENYFVFTSDRETRHIRDLEAGNTVAASIVLETRVVGRIRGLQIQGILLEPSGAVAKEARKRYLKRFPYAALMETTLWILRPRLIKMTDNRLGFGKKLIWEEGGEES